MGASRECDRGENSGEERVGERKEWEREKNEKKERVGEKEWERGRERGGEGRERSVVDTARRQVNTIK